MSASALRGRGSGAPPRARSVAPACVDAPTLDSQAPANQSPTPAHVAPGQLPNPLPELVLLNVCHRHWPALGGAVLADQTRVDSCELLFIKLTPGPQWQPAAERSSTSTRQAENTPGGQLAASPRARAAAGSFGPGLPWAERLGALHALFSRLVHCYQRDLGTFRGVWGEALSDRCETGS